MTACRATTPTAGEACEEADQTKAQQRERAWLGDILAARPPLNATSRQGRDAWFGGRQASRFNSRQSSVINADEINDAGGSFCPQSGDVVHEKMGAMVAR